MLQDIWTPDVKANQLADVISGVSPIRSMVNVGSGVADLILLPIEQYKKDGRIARGVQRGTNSFVRSTAMEMMKLGAKLATGTQVILERAEGVLGGGSKFRDDVIGEVGADSGRQTVESDDDEGDMVEVVSRYANQPTDAREGVQAAYKSLSSNINSAAQTILAVPMEVYERSGENVSCLLSSCGRKADMVGTAQSRRSGCTDRCIASDDWRFRGGQQDSSGCPQQLGPDVTGGAGGQVQVMD